MPTRGAGDFAVNRSSIGLLGKVDAVVFDCDGVLIDARRSYDATIRVVVETMVEEMTGVRLRLARAIPRLIATMRSTGGFNSDWDTTYAMTLFSLVALRRKGGQGAKGAGAIEGWRESRPRSALPRGGGAGGGRLLPWAGVPNAEGEPGQVARVPRIPWDTAGGQDDDRLRRAVFRSLAL